MFFPQNDAPEAEFVGSISKWFKPVQFLLDQAMTGHFRCHKAEEEVERWRCANFQQVIITPALGIEHSTSFIGIFLPLF